MNYVLYLIGGVCILFGLLGLGKQIEIDPQNVFANTLIIYISGSLMLSGILICAMGSAIGLLKKIARNTDPGA